MPQLELERTYLSLDGQGQVKTHPVEGFWETIGTNTELLGTLVSASVSTADWPHWEMHRALVQETSRLLGITYGAGTRHRPK